MPVWYRVFAAGDAEPSPAAILERLNALAAVSGDFGGDAAGWFRADFTAPGGVALHLERFLSAEEGVRAELNSWAAHIESGGDDPDRVALMERIIQTKQLFTLERPDDAADASGLCEELCRCLARMAAGVYQIDGRGFFSPDGALLAPDE
jgi:hypothetical protein